jgi:hypothetical protein
VLDEFTSRREVARVETRLIFRQRECGPLLPPVRDAQGDAGADAQGGPRAGAARKA